MAFTHAHNPPSFSERRIPPMTDPAFDSLAGHSSPFSHSHWHQHVGAEHPPPHISKDYATSMPSSSSSSAYLWDAQDATGSTSTWAISTPPTTYNSLDAFSDYAPSDDIETSFSSGYHQPCDEPVSSMISQQPPATSSSSILSTSSSLASAVGAFPYTTLAQSSSQIDRPKFEPASWDGHNLYRIDPEPDLIRSSSRAAPSSPPSSASSVLPPPSIKQEEPTEDGFIFELSSGSTTTLSTSHTTMTPSFIPMTEVPLRATQASKEMRSLMSVFRLDPFAMHNGIRTSAGRGKGGIDDGDEDVDTNWLGEEIGPLQERPKLYEWEIWNELKLPIIDPSKFNGGFAEALMQGLIPSACLQAARGVPRPIAAQLQSRVDTRPSITSSSFSLPQTPPQGSSSHRDSITIRSPTSGLLYPFEDDGFDMDHMEVVDEPKWIPQIHTDNLAPHQPHYAYLGEPEIPINSPISTSSSSSSPPHMYSSPGMSLYASSSQSLSNFHPSSYGTLGNSNVHTKPSNSSSSNSALTSPPTFQHLMTPAQLWELSMRSQQSGSSTSVTSGYSLAGQNGSFTRTRPSLTSASSLSEPSRSTASVTSSSNSNSAARRHTYSSTSLTSKGEHQTFSENDVFRFPEDSNEEISSYRSSTLPSLRAQPLSGSSLRPLPPSLASTLRPPGPYASLGEVDANYSMQAVGVGSGSWYRSSYS